MRLLPTYQPKGTQAASSVSSPSYVGRRKAKPVAGLDYLLDDNPKVGGEAGDENKNGARRRRRKGPPAERKKARRINYEVLTESDGLPALYNRMKTFQLDESLSLIDQLDQLITPYREWSKDLMPNYTFDDFIERTEKMSGTLAVKGMLDSLQHGEGFPSMEQILNKRRAKIDELPDREDAREEDADNRAWEAERQLEKPDREYRPDREETNHFLADDDDDAPIERKPTSVRSSDSRATTPREDDFNLEDLLAKDGHKAVQEMEEYEQRVNKQKELHQQWLEEKAREEERRKKLKEEQKKERERKKKQAEERKKRKEAAKKRKPADSSSSESSEDSDEEDEKRKRRQKANNKKNTINKKNRKRSVASSSESESNSDSEEDVNKKNKTKRSSAIDKRKGKHLSSDDEEEEKKEQVNSKPQPIETKPVVRRVAKRRGTAIAPTAGGSSASSLSGAKRKATDEKERDQEEDSGSAQSEDESRTAKRRRVEPTTEKAPKPQQQNVAMLAAQQDVDDVPLAVLLGIQ